MLRSRNLCRSLTITIISYQVRLSNTHLMTANYSPYTVYTATNELQNRCQYEAFPELSVLCKLCNCLYVPEMAILTLMILMCVFGMWLQTNFSPFVTVYQNSLSEKLLLDEVLNTGSKAYHLTIHPRQGDRTSDLCLRSHDIWPLDHRTSMSTIHVTLLVGQAQIFFFFTCICELFQSLHVTRVKMESVLLVNL